MLRIGPHTPSLVWGFVSSKQNYYIYFTQLVLLPYTIYSTVVIHFNSMAALVMVKSQKNLTERCREWAEDSKKVHLSAVGPVLTNPAVFHWYLFWTARVLWNGNGPRFPMLGDLILPRWTCFGFRGPLSDQQGGCSECERVSFLAVRARIRPGTPGPVGAARDQRYRMLPGHPPWRKYAWEPLYSLPMGYWAMVECSVGTFWSVATLGLVWTQNPHTKTCRGRWDDSKKSRVPAVDLFSAECQGKSVRYYTIY